MVSVIVCTRNRADILADCLRSLTDQDDGSTPYEIVVVDNGSSDGTAAMVEALARDDERVRYVSEPRIGLSCARNAGARAARFEYLAYLDDDGHVDPTFIGVVRRVIEEHAFACFGGWVTPVFRTPKPAWLPQSFGYYKKWSDRTTALTAGQDLPGGIFIVKHAALTRCGGFPEGIGMRGSSIGYGEENVVQQKLRKQGNTIGFCPDLVLHHLVAEYKFSVVWHLKRQFALARDRRALRRPLRRREVAWAFARGILLPLPLLCANARRFFGPTTYYWQNWLLDSLKEPLRALGAAVASTARRAA